MASYTALQRARRQASNSPAFAAIFDLVFEEATGAMLVQAATDGRPPAAAISKALVERLGRDAFAGAQARQHAGLCVAARLEDLGWIVDGTRTRVAGDPLFQTASLFKRAPTPSHASAHDLLGRFVSMLDDEEASILADLLEARRKRGTSASRPTPTSDSNRQDHADTLRGQHED